MSGVRAWLRRFFQEPGAVVTVLAIAAVLATILLTPPVPADTAVGPPPAYGTTQPDTMQDALEYRVEQLERQNEELWRRVEELEAGR